MKQRPVHPYKTHRKHRHQARNTPQGQVWQGGSLVRSGEIYGLSGGYQLIRRHWQTPVLNDWASLKGRFKSLASAAVCHKRERVSRQAGILLTTRHP